MDKSMKKVLLIGANSYIAKSFEAYCKNEEILIRVDKVSASNDQWKEVSLTEYDSILMFAAIVHQKEHDNMEKLYMDVNCKLPVSVAKKAKDDGVKQFVFLSTAAVYGSSYTQIMKDTKPMPETFYGKSKYQAEKELFKLEDDTFLVAVLRSPKVLGKGCKGNFVKLDRLVRYTFFFPNVHNQQSVIHIDKLAKTLLEIVQNQKTGIFLPQDEAYFDIAQYVVNKRKQMGKKTVLVPGFSKIINVLSKYIPTIKKMFGNLYYDV